MLEIPYGHLSDAAFVTDGVLSDTQALELVRGVYFKMEQGLEPLTIGEVALLEAHAAEYFPEPQPDPMAPAFTAEMLAKAVVTRACQTDNQ
ncbi:MAG TPA: hypothetical protein VFB03_01145 [Candidatus Saccharimonadales bacterium]|nr:hypothetical protein [Candidatus Saccharimonadales bacterium]